MLKPRCNVVTRVCVKRQRLGPIERSDPSFERLLSLNRYAVAPNLRLQAEWML